MSFKRIKLFCMFLGMVVALSLIASPLMAEGAHQRPRGLYEFMQTLPEEQRGQVLCILDNAMELHTKGFIDKSKNSGHEPRMDLALEDVLTPEQLQDFQAIFTRKPGLSSTSSTCSECYSPNYWIYKALGDIDAAISSYMSSGHSCDPPPPPKWGIPTYFYVITPLERARAYLINAESQSWTAYQSCDCNKANSADSNLGWAIYYIGKAISDSNNHCDPNPPWMSKLSSAQIRANTASNGMQDCIDQACN